jgi:hypothetical protein
MSVQYEVPWICYDHGFITQDKALYWQHMAQMDHYHLGTNGTCEMCGTLLPQFKAKYTSLMEPVIILCDSCLKIPNVYKLVRDKRNAIYPALGDIE